MVNTSTYNTYTFHQELQPNERILWTGKPRQGIILRTADALLIPFSLLWAGFAFFWETAVVVGGAPFFFELWGIPFVLVGCYVLFGRFIADARSCSRTDYAVTTDRVLIHSGLFHSTLRSVNLKTLSDMTLDTKNDGRGTITFGQTNPLSGWYGNGMWFNNSRYTAPAFEQIENVREVYNLIQRAQSGLN